MPHHELWIVTVINRVLGPVVRALMEPLGFHFDPTHPVIPDYLAMCVVVVLTITALCLIVRSQLSVANPGKLQIVMEDVVGLLTSMLREYIGPKGVRYLPLVGTIGLFIFLANMLGKMPGFMSPTANLNVTLGCALTVWVYYHLQGIRTQGAFNYVKHFVLLPGAPWWTFPLVMIIEPISHLARVMSLSLRLFGNIFGEEMVVLIIGSIVPFIAPLPMMVLGVVTGTLQAFIFVLLTMIYLAAAVHSEHDDEHGHEHGSGAHAAA